MPSTAFTLVESQPVAASRHDIVVNGRRVGEVVQSSLSSGRMSWHACLQTPEHGTQQRIHAPCCGLIQGHGDTPDEAIAKAFQQTLAVSELFIEQVKDLRAEMGLK